MPKRIQRKRTKGWRMPPNAIYVGRPTKWGNPEPLPPNPTDYEAEACVEGYEVALWSGNLPIAVSDVRRELRGRDLCCWCPLDRPCHADVLLEVANA